MCVFYIVFLLVVFKEKSFVYSCVVVFWCFVLFSFVLVVGFISFSIYVLLCFCWYVF